MVNLKSDKAQLVYADFVVPDPGRIRKVREFILNYIAVGNDKARYRVLEFGVCKNGLADTLSRNDLFECVGVDINPRQIEGITIHQADVNNGFPELEGKFDFIFAGEFIEHLYDDRLFIRSCKEKLSKNGVLILTVPNLFYSLNRVKMLFGMMPFFSDAPGHYHIYTKDKISRLLVEEGLQLEYLVSSHILFPRISPVNVLRLVKEIFGPLFEILGDYFPGLGAHIIICAKRI